MRWIDFEGKNPTYPADGWTPWPEEKWQKWLEESNRLLSEISLLNSEAENLRAEGKNEEADIRIAERNKHIDNNSGHWGKLKPWLFALSHGKCWFTEGRDICSHMEVEHFRPKKESKNLKGVVRDGYWWLAFDYSNFRAVGNVPNRKKGGWFPLKDGSVCSQYDCRCEDSEFHYLLDPIDPEDVDLIAFDEEGNAIPAPGISDWDRERVEESIKRYKLNEHDALPAERRKVWTDITRTIELYRKYKSQVGPGVNIGAKIKLTEQIRHLKRCLKEDAELSSVAKWCILTKNDPLLNKHIP